MPLLKASCFIPEDQNQDRWEEVTLASSRNISVQAFPGLRIPRQGSLVSLDASRVARRHLIVLSFQF